MIIVLRVGDCGMLNSKWHVYIIPSSLNLGAIKKSRMKEAMIFWMDVEKIYYLT